MLNKFLVCVQKHLLEKIHVRKAAQRLIQTVHATKKFYLDEKPQSFWGFFCKPLHARI